MDQFFRCEKSWSRSFWNDPIINDIRLIFNFEFGNSGIMSNIEGIIWTKINFSRRLNQKAFFEFKLAKFEPINAYFSIFCWNYYIFSADNKIKDLFCVLYNGDPLTRDPRTTRFWDFQIFIGPGPSRSGISSIFSILIRAGSRMLKFFRSWSGPRFLNFAANRTRTEPLGPG